MRRPLDRVQGRLMLATLMLLVLAGPGWGACPKIHRSRAVLRAFVKTHPCPATGLHTVSCKGADGTRYVIDHREPLCKLGKAGDVVTNLAWQEYRASLRKDRLERQQCHVAPGHCAHQGD